MTVNRVVIIAVVAIAAAAVAGWFLTGLGGGQRLLEPEAVTGAVRVDPDTVTVGERVSWSVSFVPGPDGFPHGGRLMIRFPHNHFSTVPASEIYQDEAPEAPGYAGVTQPVSGVRLEVRPIEYGRIGIFLENNGPDLPGEETIDVAILNLPAPPVAQNDFLFQVIVDRDGDGEYGIVRSVNPVRVLPGAPERLACVAQSLIDPGARPWIGCRLEDARGNPTEGLRGNLHASVTASGRRFSSMTLARSLATQRFEGPVLAQPGVYTIDVEAQTDERVLSTATNLVLAERREDGRRLLWADLHGHSALSDGRGTPEEYYEYARDVSFLDAAALSDHDWQLTETEFRRTVDAAEQFNARGAFVTVPAMEINIRGHELIYFFDTDRLATVRIGRVGGAQDFWQELFADMAPGVPLTSYKDMLAAFNDDEILIASHTTLSAGMGTPRGDPAPRQSLIEIYSAHGSSECAGCPRRRPTATIRKKRRSVIG
ncbi:MAG: hypothetical protein M5R36_08935 [Deltaproteobacteria bacterium]|nr:hypothetical protein [Deltaproteobacteria bacterium]